MSPDPLRTPYAHILTVIDAKEPHDIVLVAIGLAALLKLQYDHEGHMDSHVHDLFFDMLHFAEFQLSNDSPTDSVDQPDL